MLTEDMFKLFGGGKLLLNYEKCANADHGATWDNCLSKFELKYDKLLFTKKDLIRYGRLRYFVSVIVNLIKIKKNRPLEYGKSGRILKMLGIIMNSNLDMHKGDRYYEKLPSNKTLWCTGLFQNPEIIKTIKKELQREVTLKPEFISSESTYRNLLVSMSESNSVAVHIRRGDYINHSIMGVCTDEYYHKAVKIAKDRMSDAKFYVFSDDIEYAKILFSEEKDDFIFVSGSFKDYEELMLMKSCKHFIISNSSFSYWGQFLAESEDKIVISPAHWIVGAKGNSMADSNWVLL